MPAEFAFISSYLLACTIKMPLIIVLAGSIHIRNREFKTNPKSDKITSFYFPFFKPFQAGFSRITEPNLQVTLPPLAVALKPVIE